MTWTLLAIIAVLAAFGAAISIAIYEAIRASRWRRNIDRWLAQRDPPRVLTRKERIAATEPEIRKGEPA